jgi:hypothetical protein
MAKMGKGTVGPSRNGSSGDSPVALSGLTVNLVAAPMQIQPTAIVGFSGSGSGYPIMREGFITRTGVMPTARPGWNNTQFFIAT